MHTKPSELAPYLEAGYQLIPLNRWDFVDDRGRERGKSPRDSNWLRREYGPGDAAAWMEGGGNVGVRLRATDVVIDFDPRNVPPEEYDDPRLVLDALELEYGVDLSACPCARTGSGGLHYYLRLPDGVRVRNGLEGFPGVEFKSLGRQVVAPGSVHPCGRHYEWDELSPPVSQAPMAPEALVEAIRKPDRSKAAGAPSRIARAHVGHCLGQLDPEAYREHDQWFELMEAVHFASGGDPEVREDFVAWSARDPQYADYSEDVRARWDSLDPDPEGPAVGVGTLFKHVMDAGGDPRTPPELDFEPVPLPEGEEEEDRYVPKLDRLKSGHPKATYGNGIEAVKGLGIRPEHDDFHGRCVLRGDLGDLRSLYPSADELWSDELLAMVRRVLLEKYRLELSARMVAEVVEAVALERRFNPLAEYLTALEWDGEPRIGSWLIRYAGAEPGAYSQAVGRNFLLGAVARALVPGIKFDFMMILEGRQGTGKSSLLRALGGDYTLEGLPHKNNLNDRDVIAAMQGHWIVEVEELASLRKADVESLKAFITRTEDRARLAYGHLAQDYPRRCVFVGTTNESSYLTDATGNRRFLPVSTGRIDVAGARRDRDQLWAEATRAWLERPDPDALYMPDSVQELALAQQEQRRAADPWEDEVASYLAKANPEGEWIKAQTILLDACRRSASECTTREFRRLANIMAGLGWNRVRRRPQDGKNPTWGYELPEVF